MDDFTRAKRVLKHELQDSGVNIDKVSVNKKKEKLTLFFDKNKKSKVFAVIPPAFSFSNEEVDSITFDIDMKLFRRYYNKNYTDEDFMSGTDG